MSGPTYTVGSVSPQPIQSHPEAGLRDLSTVDTVVIHCADTPNGYWRYTAASIDEWHRIRGFRREESVALRINPNHPHIGYHRVLLVGGDVIPGRSLEEIGAHVDGHNTTSIGLCLIGQTKFSLAQWDALTREVAEILDARGTLAVRGHRFYDPQRSCPGFDVEEWISGGMKPLKDHLL